MKNNKKLKNINKKSNPKKNKLLKILLLILIIIILLITSNFIYSMLFINKIKNNKIVAVKTITTEYGQNQEVKYIIEIKDYGIEKILKEIKFQTEDEARLEYNRYEIINRCEKREIGIELNKKKLILTMPQEQFELDINYRGRRDMTYEGEINKRITQETLKQYLTDQGYEIK